jgi:hypothetical protein
MRADAPFRNHAGRRKVLKEPQEVERQMKNRLVSPVGFAVMGKAILLGGFVAPLLAFLGAAFIGGAVQARIDDLRRRTVSTAARPHRAF